MLSKFDVNKRFLHVIKSKGYSLYKISKKINELSQATLSNIKNNKSVVSTNSINLLLNEFKDINEQWLLKGEGEMIKGENNDTITASETNNKPITGYYYTDINAFAGLENNLQSYEEFEKIPVSIPNWEKDIIFINVYGDSMYPMFHSGDVIGIKPIEFEYLNYGYPYVINFQNGDVFIKVIKKGIDKDYLLLENINLNYEPKEFHASQIKKIYAIKGVIKKVLM